ncbi:MAG: hypothetical protein HQK56_06315 [Deltaproteobacteria bacterium]|nr:hypothetical protein [Deltaproteobacteria bacterium]
MKKSLVCSVALALTLLVWCLTPVAAQTNYEEELKQFNVILSENDSAAVREWFGDTDTGYPDLAKDLLAVLRGCRPKENTTVLVEIMKELKKLNKIGSKGFLKPPYNQDQVKQAFVNDWANRNRGSWSAMPQDVQNNYKEAFRHICTK